MLRDQYKIHVTAKDRQRERDMLSRFATTQNVIAIQTIGKTTLCDGFIYTAEREPLGLIEIKYRNNPQHQYPTYSIDKAKIDKLVACARNSRLKAFLLVSWQGDERFIDLTTYDLAKLKTTVRKRRDRDELADEMYDFPNGDFTRL